MEHWERKKITADDRVKQAVPRSVPRCWDRITWKWQSPPDGPSPRWLTGAQTPNTVQGPFPAGGLQAATQFLWVRMFAQVDGDCCKPVGLHARFAPWHEPFQETPREWQSCEPFLQCWREQCDTSGSAFSKQTGFLATRCFLSCRLLSYNNILEIKVQIPWKRQIGTHRDPLGRPA